LTYLEEIIDLLKEAVDADPSKFVNGHSWHDKVKDVLTRFPTDKQINH